ncbi:MAG: methyltransferase domain-containing protein [Bacteroidota bacterium]
MQHTEQVREYYENNTRRFLKLGKHRGTQNIHQALWAEGVQTPEEAVSYSNQLVLEEMNNLYTQTEKQGLSVLDLGCGVGSSVLYVAEHFVGKGQFTGITLSPLQAQLAEERRQMIQLDQDVRFLAGDFLNLPDLPPQQIVFAIEAFVHAADPDQFFREVGRVLDEGGKLILIDDFMSKVGTQTDLLTDQQKNWLKDFQEGWLANSLISIQELKKLASQYGLELIKDRNLTPYMEIGRLRDQLIGVMIRFAGPAMRQSTYFKSLTGGYAKQQCLKTGLVSYRQLVLRKEK